MSLDQFVDFEIQVNNSGVTREGFGLIGILSHKNLFAARTKLYARTADMVTDGFAIDSPEVRSASRILQQQPSTKRVLVLRASDSAVIQKYELPVKDTRDDTDYIVTIEGEGFDKTVCTHDSGSGATATSIVDALVILLNAIVDKTFTATNVGDVLTIIGDDVGDWFSVEIDSYDLLGIAQTHDDFDIAASLDAIIRKDRSWYWIDTSFNSQDYVLAVSAWVEENKRAYIVDVNESDSVEVLGGLALGSDTPTDTLESLCLLEQRRTLYQWHQRPAAKLSAGLMGLLAPKNTGRWTAKGKTVVGVEPANLDDNQVANLLSRRANSYTAEGGKIVTWEGTIANLEYGFLDVTVSLDWVSDATIKACFAVSTANDIVNFTDEDIAMYEAAIKGQVILEALSPSHKIMAPGSLVNPDTDPPPSISFPLVADIDPSVRALRELPDGQLTFRLAGAVHKVFVRATVSF